MCKIVKKNIMISVTIKPVVFIFVYYFITLNSYTLPAALTNATEGPKASVKRMCVVNGSEFKDILKSSCFVDKSLIIKDFLNMESRFVRVTTPRGFGKTVNLNMLKAFLQADNGLITSTQTEDCSLFIKHNLNIFKFNKTFFHLHCGKYPVIFVTFKNITGNTFNDVLDAFRRTLHNLFLVHKYLLKSTLLNDKERKGISIYTDEIMYRNIAEDKLKLGLRRLSEKLYLHFNKKVIVLVDDFDTLIWRILSTDFKKSDVRITIFFINCLMSSLLEGYSCVERALINDCLRLSMFLLWQTTNIAHLTFLENHPLVKFYGLTEEEVTEKLNYFNIVNRHEDVKEYYNGYNVQDSGDRIYSTWSVLNYLQTGDLKDYWIDTAGLQNLSVFLLQRNVLSVLDKCFVCQKTVISIPSERMEYISLNQIMSLKEMMPNNWNWSILEAENYLLLLSDNGYFNLKQNGSLVLLNIPNKEIYQHLYKSVHWK